MCLANLAPDVQKGQVWRLGAAVTQGAANWIWQDFARSILQLLERISFRVDRIAGPRNRSDRRAVATLISLLLHAGLALILWGKAGSESVGGGGGGAEATLGGSGTAIYVNLIKGGTSARSTASADQAISRLRQVMAKTDSQLFVRQDDAEPNRPKASLDKLLGQTGTGQTQNEGPAGKVAPPVRVAAEGKSNGSNAGSAGPRTPGRSAPVAGSGDRLGDLWPQIEPCWKRLPNASLVVVSLEVTLLGDGRLAGPPRVVATAQSSRPEARTIAIARAVQAVSACLPYRKLAGGNGGVFRVEFGTSN